MFVVKMEKVIYNARCGLVSFMLKQIAVLNVNNIRAAEFSLLYNFTLQHDKILYVKLEGMLLDLFRNFH